MTATKKPRAPTGLGVAGKALWGRLNERYSFDPREQAILDAACRQVDLVVELERVLTDDGVIVVGSKGQQRVSGLVAEVRQGRLCLAKLLGDLQLPSEEQQRAATWRSAQAKKAADSRWTRKRELDARRARIMAQELGDGAATGA